MLLAVVGAGIMSDLITDLFISQWKNKNSKTRFLPWNAYNLC